MRADRVDVGASPSEELNELVVLIPNCMEERCAPTDVCPGAAFMGPNVRHERRRKGREAAFGTSARWRG